MWRQLFDGPMAPVGSLGGAGQGVTHQKSPQITGLLQRSVCPAAITLDVIFFVQCKILRLIKSAVDIMADIRDTEPSLPFQRVIFILLGNVFKNTPELSLLCTSLCAPL